MTTTPFSKLISDVKTLLSNKVSDLTVYDYWPGERYKLPCAILYIYSTVDYLEYFGSKRRFLVIGLTIDIWARTPDKRDEYADNILTVMKDNVDDYGYLMRITGARDLVERVEKGFYRKVLDFEVVVAVT